MIEVKKAKLKLKKNKLTKVELKEIKELLEYASEQYYNTDKKILADGDYDYMYDSYIRLGGEPIIGANPSRKDGKDSEESRIVDTEHKYPKLVGTTLKSHNLDEFNEWIDKIYKSLNLKSNYELSLVATLKFDGNSILIEYDKDGNVLRALTRGKNGKGKDLSKIFKDKRFKIKNTSKKEVAVKHECLLRFSDLERIKKDLGITYNNPRNGVSGMLNGNDGIKFRDYYTLEPLWVEFSDENVHYNSVREREIDFINRNFKDNDNTKNMYDISGTLNEIKENMKIVYNEILDIRKDLDFMIDGIVVDIESDKFREKLGYIESSDNPTPKWCNAVKFPYEEIESEVTDIKYSFGDSGKISPVCHFKPVKMSNGTTHSKQYLQGYKRFKELQLCKGTRILIQLHNDTLSYIERLDTIKDDKKAGRKPIKFIKKCPKCGEPLEIQVNEFGEETFVYCTNPFCVGRSVGRINNFLTKMDIKGIKENTIEKLHTAGLWNTIEDLFTFDPEKGYKIEGLGKKSIDSIVRSIERKKYYDYEILGSLGIRNFGIDTAKLVCNKLDLDYIIGDLMPDIMKFYSLNEKDFKSINKKKYDSLEEKYDAYALGLFEALTDIDGIADKTADALIQGLIDNFELIIFLMRRGYKKLSDEQIFDDNRYTFVITGDLETCDRSVMKKILERHGHKLVGSVSGKTDYLITNSPLSGTVKIKKAKELGKPIITEKEFLELLGYDMDEEISAVKQKY